MAPATLATAAPAARWDSTSFVMNAKVLDGGQQVVSLTLDTAGRTVDPRSLTASTFRVRAKGVNPYAGLAPSEVAGTFDVQRTVTGAHLDRSGDIVVELAHGEGVPGASTLAYATKPGRNVVRDLTYSLTQTAPVRLKSGAAVQLTSFHQGGVVDPEVDAFGAGASRSGLKYRYYAPKKSLRPARSKDQALEPARVGVVAVIEPPGPGLGRDDIRALEDLLGPGGSMTANTPTRAGSRAWSTSSPRATTSTRPGSTSSARPTAATWR